MILQSEYRQAAEDNFLRRENKKTMQKKRLYDIIEIVVWMVIMVFISYNLINGF